MKLILLFIGLVAITVKLSNEDYKIENIIKKQSERIEVLESSVSDLQNKLEIMNLTVTAYSPEVKQTDSTPYMTAIMVKVRTGQIAVSRDLFKNGYTFGKKIYIEGMGVYVIADLMHPRWTKRVDIFVWTRKRARKIGIKYNVQAVLLNL